MRFKGAIWVLGLLCAARLSAGSGSPEAWLSGTQAWDTTPQLEADLELYHDGGDAHPDFGSGAQVGLLDWLQAGVEGRWLTDGSAAPLQLTVEAREPYYRDSYFNGAELGWQSLLPPLALLGRWDRDGARWQGTLGLIAVLNALDGLDCSGQVNFESDAQQALTLRAGFWSPYVVSMLRLGLEYRQWTAPQAGAIQGMDWTPQLLINAPGDLSLSLGLRLDALHAGAPRYLIRLSYEIFPNP